MSNSKVNILNLDTNNIKVLKSKETINLIKLYKEGKILRDDIVLGNLKLVLSAVNSYKKNCNNLDDIFQVGVVGLMKAIDNFNPDFNLMFSTYAVPMIKGEIRRYLRDNSLLKVSRQLKDIAYKALKENETELKKNNRTLTNEELAKKLNVDVYDVQEAFESLQTVSSLSDPVFNDFDDSVDLYDTLAYDKEANNKLVTDISLNEGMSKLDPFERKIILKRYYDGQTQVEIAKEFDISQAQVSRIEKNALSFLKKYVY